MIGNAEEVGVEGTGMTPEQWHRLTPQQQAWYHQQWQQQQWRQAPPPQYLAYPQPAAPAVPSVNVAGMISIVSGILALLVIPILLGPVALVSGIVGERIAIRTAAPGRWMSATGAVLGAITTLIALVAFSRL